MLLDKNTQNKMLATFGSFLIDRVWGGNNTPFIRFGYWNRVDSKLLQEIIGDKFEVVEQDDDDDDCFPRFMYKLIERK